MGGEEEAFAEGGSPNAEEKEKEAQNVVPFYKLFVFSDWWDKILMVVGTLGAIGNGMNPPLMALLFGELADAFGRTQTDNVLPVVCKVSLKLVYVALGCGAAAFLRKHFFYPCVYPFSCLINITIRYKEKNE